MSESPTPETITIPLGNTGTAPYAAYGDESQFSDVLVYCYVIADKNALPKIESDLLALKTRFKIPVEKELHCRLLCSPRGRSQGGYEFLDKDTVEQLLFEAFELMASNNIAIRFSISDYRQHRDQYGDNLTLQNRAGEKQTLRVHRLRSGGIDPKAIMGNLSSHIWAMSLLGQSMPSAKQCDIYVSAEPSVVKLFGDKHRPAHDHYSMFLDIDTPPGYIFRIEPVITTYRESFMVQLADIAAFTCSHSGLPDQSMDFYRGLLRIYNNAKCFPYQVHYPPELVNE